jgi:hypothetical protein
MLGLSSCQTASLLWLGFCASLGVQVSAQLLPDGLYWACPDGTWAASPACYHSTADHTLVYAHGLVLSARLDQDPFFSLENLSPPPPGWNVGAFVWEERAHQAFFISLIGDQVDPQHVITEVRSLAQQSVDGHPPGAEALEPFPVTTERRIGTPPDASSVSAEFSRRVTTALSNCSGAVVLAGLSLGANLVAVAAPHVTVGTDHHPPDRVVLLDPAVLGNAVAVGQALRQVVAQGRHPEIIVSSFLGMLGTAASQVPFLPADVSRGCLKIFLAHDVFRSLSRVIRRHEYAAHWFTKSLVLADEPRAPGNLGASEADVRGWQQRGHARWWVQRRGLHTRAPDDDRFYPENLLGVMRASSWLG